MKQTACKLFFILFLFSFSVIGALEGDELTDRQESYQPVQRLRVDINADGDFETIRIAAKPMEGADHKNWVLHIVSEGQVRRANHVLGYSAIDPSLHIIQIVKPEKSFVAVEGPNKSGNWELALYSYTDQTLKLEQKIFSDWPYIALEDVDEDGNTDIVVTKRIYDTDAEEAPEDAHQVHTYVYAAGAWRIQSIFDSARQSYIPLAHDTFYIEKP